MFDAVDALNAVDTPHAVHTLVNAMHWSRYMINTPDADHIGYT